MRDLPYRKKIVLSLLVLSVMAVSLSLSRTQITQNFTHIWMNWNLFLAWLPLVAAIIASQLHSKGRSVSMSLFLLIWLLFLPNAPYMMTDLIHIATSPQYMLWYDGIMFFTFALVGIGTWVSSLTLVEEMICRQISTRIHRVIFISSISLLTGFGVYLGRELRFNSWDLLHNGSEIWRAIGDVILHPTQHQPVVSMTIIFAVMLMIAYFIYRSFTPAIVCLSRKTEK